MLRATGTAKKVAYSSVFAVLYSITRLFQVSAYVGINSTLTFGEAFSPLAGMLFGPYIGALSVTLGTFLDFLLGRPVVFDGLDFVPGAIAAAVAGLCYSGRIKGGLALPVFFMVVFTLDPLSSSLIPVGSVEVPFLWMHIVSLVTMGSVWLLVERGQSRWVNSMFVASIVFLSTMSAHVAGAVLYENVLGRINAVFPASKFASLWTAIFYLYPIERLFFTVAGALIAVPVLTRLSRLQKPDDGVGHLSSPGRPSEVVSNILPPRDYLAGGVEDSLR